MRRIGNAQQFVAFLDRLVADIEGRGNRCHGFSPNREQKFIGGHLKLALPGCVAGFGASGTPGDMRQAGLDGTAVHVTVNRHGHENLFSGNQKTPALHGSPLVE